jgi:hypothetical protein
MDFEDRKMYYNTSTAILYPDSHYYEVRLGCAIDKKTKS